VTVDSPLADMRDLDGPPMGLLDNDLALQHIAYHTMNFKETLKCEPKPITTIKERKVMR
jgi:hypothetical protein